MIPFGNFAIDVKCVHKQYRLCLLQLPCFYVVLLRVLWKPQNLTTRNLSYYMKPEIMKNVQRVKELAHFRSAKRRKSIKNFCQKKRYSIPKLERNNAANITNRWRQEMWWDIKSGFAWCCVYKGCSNISIVFHRFLSNSSDILNFHQSRILNIPIFLTNTYLLGFLF